MEKCALLLLLATVAFGAEMRKAIVHLEKARTSYRGNVTFEQEEGKKEVKIMGIVEGLDPGKHGFHVHEKGDINPCDKAGGHFNPHMKQHGSPMDMERHVGDLGNIEVNDQGIAYINMTDNMISLWGGNSIIGRALVVHFSEDDLGKGTQSDSKTTGHAGARVVCGVIGIQDPVNPWYLASSTTQISALSVGFLTLVAAFLSKL